MRIKKKQDIIAKIRGKKKLKTEDKVEPEEWNDYQRKTSLGS